jgi:hypothetical protein
MNPLSAAYSFVMSTRSRSRRAALVGLALLLVTAVLVQARVREPKRACANVFRANELSGFGSNANNMLHHLRWNKHPATAAYDHRSSPFSCVNGTWSDVFQGPLPRPPPSMCLDYLRKLSTDDAIRRFSTHVRSNKREYGKALSKHGLTFNIDTERLSWPSESTKLRGLRATCLTLCPFLTNIWRPEPHLSVIVKETLQTALTYPRPVVVMQLRGGDKVFGDAKEEEPYDVERSLSRMAAEGGSALANGTCILIGDDASLRDVAISASRRFLNCLIVDRIAPSGARDSVAFRAENLATRCAETRKVVADISLMGQADAIVALFGSSTAKMGMMLSFCQRGGSLPPAWGWSGESTEAQALSQACYPR